VKGDEPIIHNADNESPETHGEPRTGIGPGLLYFVIESSHITCCKRPQAMLISILTGVSFLGAMDVDRLVIALQAGHSGDLGAVTV